MAIHIVFTMVAVESTGLAEAGIVYQVSYDFFSEFATIDEG
jgi:hypothetical protein